MIIRSVLIAIFAWSSVQCIAQTDNISEKILKSLSKGDAGSLAADFNSTVDIEIPGNEGTFSKSQAEGIMADFFRKNPPASAEYIHKGSSEGGSQYFIGNYSTASKKFRFYILLKNISGKQLIHQVQFEAD